VTPAVRRPICIATLVLTDVTLLVAFMLWVTSQDVGRADARSKAYDDCVVEKAGAFDGVTLLRYCVITSRRVAP
jgi:hypothetical protein